MTIVLAFLLDSFMVWLSNVVRNSVELSQEKCKKLSELVCPSCSSGYLIRKGSIHNDNPKHQCKNCGYQFVDNSTKTTILSKVKQLIDRLLLERISLRGIARVTQVIWSWLQDYVNQRLSHTPCQIEISVKSPGRLTIECDAQVVIC